ncbi:MAG: hypothetical protein Q9165_005907 [Trypethelium subeluteriae]
MAFVPDGPPPSTVAAAFATGIIGLVTGYFIGQGSSIGLFGGPRKSEPMLEGEPDEDENEDEDEEAEDTKQELRTFSDSNEECKLVLVVRTDLGMTKGKIAAQCSHATLACYKAFLRQSPDSPILKRWERYGQAKIAVQVKSEDDILVLQAQAVSLGVCAQVIHDAGRTQIVSGSATVLGVGPAPKGMVDQVTGHLKLL